MHVLEAVIAGTILVSFIAAIGSFYIFAPENPDLNTRAYAVLEGLENMGLLRNYTVALDYDGLNNEVPVYNYNHSIQICDPSGTCFGNTPSKDTVWAGSYIIAGESGYTPYEVKLYIWED